MTEAVGENGRATIREVHQLLTETRVENEKHLGNMEERLMKAIYASETRLLDSVGNLSARVAALEEWREEARVAHIEYAAIRDERLWLLRAPVNWASAHWQIIVVVAAILIAIVAFLIDTRIDVQPQG